MFVEFNSHTGLDSSDLSHEFITITDTDIDANFLLHHFLSHFLQKHQQGGKATLLAFAHTLAHYTSAVHKIGSNLHTYITRKQLQYVDGLRMLFDGFMCRDGDDTAIASHLFTSTTSNTSLKQLFHLLNAMSSSTHDEDGPILIVVDDLCSLINIGVPAQAVSDFLHYCKTLTTRVERDISFVFLTHADSDDPEYTLVHELLRQYTSMEVNVRALKSGYSKELSGDMNICWNKHNVDKHLHFKLLDKDVKFYAPGTSSAVL